MPKTEVTPKQRIEQFAERHKITMTAEFINWHNSRNGDKKDPSLNWKVSLLLNGRVFMTTDYMAGCGHCPGNKRTELRPYERNNLINWECEFGYAGRPTTSSGTGFRSVIGLDKKPVRLLPELADVLYSLSMDASALTAGGFEEWCSDFGYETDSRAAKETYDACVEVGSKLLSAIGHTGMTELAEACQDY